MNTPSDSCCDDTACTSGSRNRYYVGKRLTPASFDAEQDYQLQRRRLINRAIHGWGVVHGLALTPADAACGGSGGALQVGPGLALDRAGRELVVATARTLRYADVIQAGATKTQDNEAGCWLLSAHYAERRMEPVMLKDDCHCERHEWDRVCEDVVFSLRPIDCAECCVGEPCELCCSCMGDCEDPLSPHNRGPHRCLCTHLTGLAVGAQIESLCKVGDCVDADLHNGVALACVSLKADDCGGWVFDTVVDGCGPRRLVKRNDLLFDLIRGCDLTVIDEISWAPWHRSLDPVALSDFSARFSTLDTPPDACVTDFWVHFSRPVSLASLQADAFSMTVVGPQESTGWGDMLRVPIVGIRPDELSGASNEFASKATLVVDGEWFADELRRGAKRWSVFRDDVSQVEIEVRGDYLVDCNGQAVDANPRGLQSVPSGNGTPGGTYLSTFSVAPASAEADTKPK